MNIKKPIIGITMGDPASIGPEITMKVLACPQIYKQCCPLVVGDFCIMEKAREITNTQHIKLTAVERVEDA